ncbi:MAG: hypothetical protein M3N17_00165 [Actinomycetota bacterium]|nr:hypothetical protein [Actinomycetota bacterium]
MRVFEGWSFRSATPRFDGGDEITVFVTGYESGEAVARIGDTVLHIDEAPEGLLDTKVRLRVDEFDQQSHTGRASYLETVGAESF